MCESALRVLHKYQSNFPDKVTTDVSECENVRRRNIFMLYEGEYSSFVCVLPSAC